jgi:16S rRNA (cytosine967-C5)-methyltransferase
MVERGTFLDRSLNQLRERLKGPEAEGQRLHFLATGATKWRGRLDYELQHRLTKGLTSLPPDVRAILRLGLFELRMSDTPDYAAVDAAVRLAHSRGVGRLAGVVNGVLRAASREEETPPPAEGTERLAVETSHPPWLLDAVAAEHGIDQAGALAAWDNEPAPLWVRIDEGRRSLAEAATNVTSDGPQVLKEGPVRGFLQLAEGTAPDRLTSLAEGWLTVQDPSASLAALAVAPGPGDRILDLCAAPGGKTTHLAELGGGKARIVATDADPGRLRRLGETVARHGAPGVVIQSFPEVFSSDQLYDAVLVDAPCSNLGVLRRRADARWRITPEEVTRLSHIQYELLERAGELVRQGGVLIYSTCTILRQENQQVVERFLAHHTSFERDTMPEQVPGEFRTEPGVATSLPWEHSLDGAYVCRMTRRDSAG